MNPQLAAAARKENFALYASPGVNLFKRSLDRIPVKSNQHEYPVIPDRVRLLDFETNRIVKVFAHIPGIAEKVAVEPLYSQAAARSESGLCYTARRLPRRRTIEEKKYGNEIQLYWRRRVPIVGRALRSGRDAPSGGAQRRGVVQTTGI